MKKKSKISEDNYFKNTVCLNSFNSGCFFEFFFSLSPNLGAVPKTQSISPIFVILRELMEIYAKKVKKKSAFILIARNFFVPGPRGRRCHYPIFMKVSFILVLLWQTRMIKCGKVSG